MTCKIISRESNCNLSSFPCPIFRLFGYGVGEVGGIRECVRNLTVSIGFVAHNPYWHGTNIYYIRQIYSAQVLDVGAMKIMRVLAYSRGFVLDGSSVNRCQKSRYCPRRGPISALIFFHTMK